MDQLQVEFPQRTQSNDDVVEDTSWHGVQQIDRRNMARRGCHILKTCG